MRFKRALRDRDQFAAWLQGRDELREFGCFRHEEAYKTYSNLGKRLSRMILEDKTRVVFCTAVTCQTGALYQFDPMANTILWAYPATSVFLDEAGTATRPLMLIPPMTFVKTVKRFVLAGDPYQLPAFVLSRMAKQEWSESLLSVIIKLKWPYSFLDTQYRMTEPLYEHLCVVIYNGRRMSIKHARTIDQPSDQGSKLLAAMPLRFEVGRDSFYLTWYLNFIDAADEVQQSIEGGSSWNDAEIDIIEAMVLALIRKGIDANAIAICTDYTRQKKLLTARAKANGWSDIRVILTIDSSQAMNTQS